MPVATQPASLFSASEVLQEEWDRESLVLLHQFLLCLWNFFLQGLVREDGVTENNGIFFCVS